MKEIVNRRGSGFELYWTSQEGGMMARSELSGIRLWKLILFNMSHFNSGIHLTDVLLCSQTSALDGLINDLVRYLIFAVHLTFESYCLIEDCIPTNTSPPPPLQTNQKNVPEGPV